MPSYRKSDLFDRAVAFGSGILAVLSLVIIGYAVAQIAWQALVGEPKNPLSIEQAEKMAVEAAPLGSHPDAVYQWLRSRNITYSSIQGHDIQSGIDRSGDRTIVQESNINPGDIGMVIRAVIPDTYRGVLLRQEILLYFFFDHSNRLMKTMGRTRNIAP